MLVIGLSGLIGSGKSTVANHFAKLGVKIIDCDVIAHNLTAPNTQLIPELVANFGSSIIDGHGGLVREQLRDIVFANETQRLKLERIIHPQIFQQVLVELNTAGSTPYLIVVVPLLFRSPEYLAITQRNIFVDCEYAQLVQRLQIRSNLSSSQVDAILASQVARVTQLELADDVIENNSDEIELQRQVERLHNFYISRLVK